MKTTLLSLIITGIAYVTAQSASISSASSSKCLDVKGSKFQDGTVVDIAACDNSTAQIWEIFSGLTEIKIDDPNVKFCIDAQDIDTASPVVIMECNQDTSQQWIFTDDGLLTLANNTNLCLQGGTSNGQQVHTEGCNGESDQVWNLI